MYAIRSYYGSRRFKRQQSPCSPVSAIKKVFPLCVITSYSIHYTKLYENLLDNFRLGKIALSDELIETLFESLSFLTQLVHGKSEDESFSCDISPIIKRIEKVLSGDKGSDNGLRITSYNVCYTKLLRRPRPPAAVCR